MSHKFLNDSMPECSVAPWSVNRAVNKILQTVNTKMTDHPRSYKGLLSAEPDMFSPSTQYHRDSVAYGRLAIPRLLNSLRKTKNEEQLVLCLKTLTEMLRDPEKIAEAIHLHVLNPIPKLMIHKCAAVQSFTFALLFQISRLPYGKVRIVSRQAIIDRIKGAFDSPEFIVREMAYALVSGLSTNWIVVENLVSAGFVKLVVDALKHLLVELDTHKSEIINLLRALTNMTDQEQGVWECFRNDALHLKPLLLQEDKRVRQAAADLFFNMMSSPVGRLKDLSVDTSKLILSALELENPPAEVIPLLAVTTINSEARAVVLNSEKVIKTLLDFYRNPKISESLRLSVHNILTNAAEMPMGRSLLLKHKRDIAKAKTFNLIPEELMNSLISVICEHPDL